MRGLGPFIAPWLSFKLYWAAWALLLATVASLFWVRGRELGGAVVGGAVEEVQQHRLRRRCKSCFEFGQIAYALERHAARLRNRRFFSIEEINAASAPMLCPIR